MLYCRKSGPGDKSVADQEAVGRREVERIGGIVVAVFSDNLSASRYRRVLERPGFVAAKEFISSGQADLLWTFANNRAQRTLDDYVELRRLCVNTGVPWRYGSRTYDLTLNADRQATAADALRAEGQSDDIKDATQRGIDTALEANEPHGPLWRGYRIIRDEKTGRPIRREPIPKQAAVIREAAERVLAGESMLSVEEWFHRTWAEVTGTPVQKSRNTLRHLLTNPSYAGYRTSNGKIHGRGTWEPIFTDDQLERLRRLLLDPRRRTQRGSQPRHLLSYIAVCGVCGDYVMARQPKRGAASPVYRCRISHLTRRIEDVDEYVVDLLMRLLERPDAAAALASRDEQVEASIDSKGMQIEKLEADLVTFVAEAAEHRLSAAVVAQYTRGVEGQIQRLRSEMDALVAAVDPVLVGAVGPGARQRWAALSLIEQRDLIRRCISVTIMPVGKGQRGLVGTQVYPVGGLTPTPDLVLSQGE